MEVNLGRLEKVDLREIWTSEAMHFTPWLAKEENLKLLGDAIGLELELEAQEKDVGPFRADILCKEVANNSWVLIENQLERTDHTHLGQLITYAAGLKAVNIVWIADRFTDEHRAALDWLNEATDAGINFFGLEVELWKIGNSNVAPKFNIISKPNDWAKDVAQSAARTQDKVLTDSKLIQQRFWVAFHDYLKKESNVIRPTKPLPQHWMNIAMGRSGFKLCAIASFYNNENESYEGNEIRSEFVIFADDAKQQYEAIFAQKEEIEKEIGEPLFWHNPENKTMCRIYLRKTASITDETKFQENFQWLKNKLEAMHKVFGKRIRGVQ